MSIIIIKGHKAASLLHNVDFKKKWNDLYTNCRWVTPYQSYDYINSWYEAYSAQYSPLILFQLSAQDKLSGLLTLAIHKESGSFEIAGTPQTEYQAWLADTASEDTFIPEALQMLFENFNCSGLKIKFILEAVPLRWLHSKAWRKYCLIKVTKRPLINLENDTFNIKTITNKTFRIRLNRLKRQGKITYRQITDRDVLLQILPKLEVIYDFRMLATFGISPFSSDKSKRPFHLALFDKKNLLHVSVLSLDSKIVAFEIAVRDEKTLYGSIASFSPLFARFGPSRLHLFYLCQNLIENNLSCYDLTPGRDPWKDRLANEHETVFEIAIFNSSFRCNLARLKYFLKEQILQILINRGVKPANLWIIVRSFRHNLVQGILFDFFTIIFPEVNVLYRVAVKPAKQLPEHNTLSKDRIEDFLKPRPKTPEGLFNNFLVHAQKNFHASQRPYTTTSKDKLFFCGWLTESVNPKHILITLPDELKKKKVAIIRDITATGTDMSVEFIVQALSQMICDATFIPEIEEIIVIIPQKKGRLHEAINELNKDYPGLLKVLTDKSTRQQ